MSKFKILLVLSIFLFFCHDGMSYSASKDSSSLFQEVIDDFKLRLKGLKGASTSASALLMKQANVSLDPDANRDLTQLISSQGYPVQKFTVKTQDGYLLDLHRIPYGRKEAPGKRTRPSVFLQHGLLSSACDWVMNFPNDSLGFMLADHGYDVWMGNSRGNTYSRQHISLKVDDARFWDFSFDEMAKYDTPAFVDFILKESNQTSLYYVGHSQGTIMAYALFASRPEYQNKIRLFVGLAPIISLKFIQSPIKYLSYLSDKEIQLVIGRKDFLPSDLLIKLLVDTFCTNEVSRWVCTNILFLLAGPDLAYLNKTRLPVYMNHSPAGVSTKDLIHFAQMVRSKKFAMFDYGPAENLKHYNKTVPPAYDVSHTTVPSLLFTAPNDWLADPKDVEILLSTVPNIKARYDIPEWSHLDFVWATNAATECYSKILQWLPKF